MAAEIRSKKSGVEVGLVPGARGSFEVYKDGQLVFSKLELGRFPKNDQEVIALL